MPEEPQGKTTGLAGMPGILVLITMGSLFVMHAGHFLSPPNRGAEGLEADYLGASAEVVQEPVNRVRGRLGLRANDVVQREGELFYLPDIEHLTGRSFLEADGGSSHVVLRRDGRERRVTNPLPAILEFDRQLRERGIRLVLLPTPSKAMFAKGEGVMRNAGFTAFLSELESHGVSVFDPSPHFAKCAERGERLFLKTDSHWTPETMRLTATFLTAHLWREDLLPGGANEHFFSTTRVITNAGDLAQLLDGKSTGQRQETISVHPVQLDRNRNEGPVRWRRDEHSAVLVLGDSFTNVFSLEEMGWGADAGFAEGLSQALGYAIDRIARNAGGAFASREELQRHPERLDGKKLVIWQFAARELSIGDWKVLSLRSERNGSGATIAGGAIEMEGIVVAVAVVPSATRSPYRQAVMEIRLTEVRSEGAEMPRELMLLGIGVEDWKPTALAKWKSGARVKVKVVPWRSVVERYGRMRRIALEDPEFGLIDLERFWIEE